MSKPKRGLIGEQSDTTMKSDAQLLDDKGYLDTGGDDDLDSDDLSDEGFVNRVNEEWGEEEAELRQAIYF